MEENIVLILREHHMEVNRKKLASKSCYFASLFSHNFNDSHSGEHNINYDITLFTLEKFIDWVQDDKERVHVDCHSIKASMEIYVNNYFVELLNLLQLSVLFMADELTEDITEIIVLYWLLPDKVIDIWLLTKELNIKVLQDICLSVCLDRFKELPLLSLVELTKDNILQLIQNVNVRSSMEYLHYVKNEWIQLHMTVDIGDITGERKIKYVQGMVLHKMLDSITKTMYVYNWNGSCLTECMQIKNIQDPGKWLIGMQVTGRGFSIYMVGGEMGLGSGQFNKFIWRYCLISKKWYYQAKLPVPRRHMVAVCLKDKLVIVGGVGRHRLKLSTVDILNIHTGKWEKGAKVPECFTEVPPHCVMNGKLFLVKSALYIYHPEHNYWDTVLIFNDPAVKRVDALLTPNATLFLTGDHLGETVLSKIHIVKDSVCEKEECIKQCMEHTVIKNVNIVHEDDSYQLRYAIVADIGVMLLNNNRYDKHQYLHFHTEMRKDFGNITIPRLGYFDTIDLDTLYNTV